MSVICRMFITNKHYICIVCLFVCFLLVIVLSVLQQFTASDYTRYTTLISGNFSFKTFSEIRKTLDNENRWTDNKYLFFFFFKREEGSRHTRWTSKIQGKHHKTRSHPWQIFPQWQYYITVHMLDNENNAIFM